MRATEPIILLIESEQFQKMRYENVTFDNCI